MKKLLLCMLILATVEFLNAQQDTALSAKLPAYTVNQITSDSQPGKKIIYQIELNEMTGKFSKGYLANITDDSVLYIASQLGATSNNIKSVCYDNVAKIRLQRKGAAGRGALKGFLIGAGIGLFGGAIASGGGSNSRNSGYNFKIPIGQAVLAGTALFGGAGGLLGLFIGGSSQKTYKIGGKKEKHNAMKYDMLHKIYANPPVDRTIYQQ